MQAMDSPIDLVKQFLANFEKRQRNLVKRKSKLDSYREKLAKGEVLKDEQKKAVEGYESVLNSISLMQEMATQSKELLSAIEKSSVMEKSKMEQELEERTVSFLQISTCLQRFLSTLDNPSVREAIIKSSSEGNLKLLDSLRNLVTAPLLDDFTSALSEIPSHLQSREDLKSISQNLYNFVTGRSVPIPFSVTDDHPKKHTSFKDARNLCFRLMTNPVVQRSMGFSSASDDVQSHIDGDHIPNSFNGLSEHNTNRTSESSVEFAHQIPKAAHETAQGFPGQHNPFPEVSTEPIVDHIKPMGSTFNFLQASRVEVPVQLPEEPAGYNENLVVLNSESNGVVEFLSDPADVDDLNSGSHRMDNHALAGSINGEQAENGEHSHGFTNDQPAEEVEHSSQLDLKPSQIEETEVAPTVSKPISYADLVRKVSFTGPAPQRVLTESQPINKRIDKPREREDRGDLPHNPRNGYSRGGSYRGRTNNFDGRGDRGAPRRGFGPRAQNHYGRGGASRAIPQEIAQPTY